MSDFLRLLALMLSTQDNHATAWPCYQVQQKRRIWGMQREYSEGWAWVHQNDFDVQVDDDVEMQRYIFEEMGEEYTPNERYVPEQLGWHKVYYVDTWEVVTVHLTQVAAERYINANRHNLKDPRVFVGSQHRCPEWQELIRSILSFIEER